MNLPEPFIPKIHSFEQVRALAAKKAVRATVVGPVVTEADKAIKKAVSDGIIQSVQNVDFDKNQIEDILANQQTDILIQGDTSPDQLIALLKTGGIGGKGFFSQVALLKPARYGKLLMVTDGGINSDPGLKTKISLIANLAKVAKAIGLENPRVAPVAAVEAIYPQMQVTTEAAVLAKMSDRGQIKGAMVDGPLSFDVAVNMFAAHSKGITSSAVAGQADAMLASNVQVGRGLYEAMGLFCDAERGAVIIGGHTPVAINEPFDKAESRYNSIVLAALCQ